MPSFWLIAQLRAGLTRIQLQKATSDIVGGWKHHELWLTMGLRDIKQRYRRSVIGPFWLTLSMGIMVGALGLLYGGIFNQPLADYLPYIAAGFVVWGLISGLILDGAQCFIASDRLIRQLAAPVSIYVYRDVWRNLIIFAHNIWIVVLLAFVFQSNPGWAVLLAVPALAVVLFNGVWLGLLLGLVSARFRDIPQVLASIVQVAFFLTPIIWKPEMLPGRALILDLNPLYHLVEIVRAPLLGQVPTLGNWIAVLLFTLLGWLLAIFFFVVYRWRIGYWV